METCWKVMRSVANFSNSFRSVPPTDGCEVSEEPEKRKCYHPPQRTIDELNAKYKRIKIYDGSKDKSRIAVNMQKYKPLRKVQSKKKNIKKCSKKVNGRGKSKAVKKKSRRKCKARNQKCSEEVKSDECGNTQQNCINQDNDEESNKCENKNYNEIADNLKERCDETGNEDGKDEDQENTKCPIGHKRRKRATSPCCPIKKRKIIKECPCARLDKELLNVVMAVRKKTLKSQLKTVDERARLLWKSYSRRIPICKCCTFKKTKWIKLLAHQKFPFYWAVLVGDFLRPTPYENFLQFYLEENNLDLNVLEDCNFINHVEEIWKDMRHATKMPFVTDAFLHEVSEGKVNLSDDIQIRNAIDRQLQNT